ncbi:MAG: hypothetical protein HDT27_01190 [Subdoligranulum sp.]|nr:hypothetical protein [Subdoligranulum sp.]
MSQFELYCMIFYILDAEWNENKNNRLGEFLSGANPFLFSDIGSADPAIYRHFCETVTEPITIENSYRIALAYIKALNNGVVTNAFSTIDETEWIECVKEYLPQEHKGGEKDG